MMSDPLPTEKQRKLLGDLIHAAFLDLRLLGDAGEAQQASDRVDVIHNIPKEMYWWGAFRWELFLGMLATYQRKWRGVDRRSGPDCLAMLDRIEAHDA